MPEIYQDIVVDVITINTMDDLVAMQGDGASRYIKAKFMAADKVVVVEPGALVLLNALKADGTRAQSIGTVNNDGTVTVEISNQMLTIDGRVQCDISVINGEKKLTSTTFYINVKSAAITDQDIESSDEYNILKEVFLQLNGYTAAEEARREEEALRCSNETARQVAEAERVQTNNEVRELIDSFVDGMVIANENTPGVIKSGGSITVARDGTVTLNNTASPSDVTNAVTTALQRIYPVGKVEITCANVNPATYLGFGTWTQFAKGQTLFGVNTADSDFNAPGKTGGEKTHLLTAAEMPAHEHSQFKNTGERVPDTGSDWGKQGINVNQQASTGSAGGNQPHNNLPPYTTVYFWRRTA